MAIASRDREWEAAVTITSILCAVDFSRESPRLVRAALSIAAQERARVAIVHVLDPLLLQAARVEYEQGLLEQAADQDLRALIAEVSQGSGAGVTAIERLVRVGRPDEEILAEAAERGADLIVLGTHGFSGVHRVFFGSTAARVLAQSGVPVLALPPEAREPGDPAAPMPLLPLTRLLVAVDFTESCMKAVREAAVLARRWNVGLTLLHAVPGGPHLDRWKAFLDADRERRLEHARYRLQLLADELSRDRLAVRVVAEGGSPEEVIARVAAEQPGTLVVMGLRDRGMLTPSPGSTAYRLLCMTSTPVLVLPPAAEWPRALASVRMPTRRRL
jgi:nucleotide-binding universal stress UspA family protein